MDQLLSSSFEDVRNSIHEYLKSKYNKSEESFGPASPYGQLLDVINKIRENVILHMKNSVDSFDLEKTIEPRIIRNMARIAGHDPGRNISAKGSVILEKKNGVDFFQINGGKIIIKNKTKIRSNINGLFYSINTGSGSVTWDINESDFFILEAIQGSWYKQTYTGTGKINQSYSVAASIVEQPEQTNFTVKVDGEEWTRRSSLYDMMRDEKAYYARTGFNGSLDIYFGTGDNGKIPNEGAFIEVDWLASDGEDGNLYDGYIDDFSFVEPIYDAKGEEIDFKTYFTLSMLDPFFMGSNGEDINLTRNLIPLVSTNYVIALPEQFEYMIGKLGVFSHIRCWVEKNNERGGATIYLNLVPDLIKRIGNGGTYDYFTLPLESFLLGEQGKKKLIEYIRGNAVMHIGTEIKIVEPQLRKFAVFIFVKMKKENNTNLHIDNAKSSAYNIMGNVFTYINKRNRIPVSDVIALLERIPSIDSVRVEFLSERNENYHSNYFKMENYNPDVSIGIDPEMGDVLFGADEIPVLRGGWYDRDGNYISEMSSRMTGELSAFNFFVVND